MKRLISIISALLVTLVVASGAFAYSSPGSPAGYVNDFAGIIDDTSQSELENKLVEFEKNSSNEIVVVTVNSLDGDYIENYAVKLFEEWAIGKAKKDNGVLLLVAPNERELRIETGYGLEGALPDITTKSIIQNNIIPEFKVGNFVGGISAGVDSIIAVTQGEYVDYEFKDGGAGNGLSVDDWWSIIAFIVFFVAPLLSSLLASTKSWWLGGVLGGISGVIIGVLAASLAFGVVSTILMAVLGLWYDYVVSKYGLKGRHFGHGGRGFFGGGFGGSSGGFGGFGGGSSGGGGASGRW